jgi:hypothetical protein
VRAIGVLGQVVAALVGCERLLSAQG